MSESSLNKKVPTRRATGGGTRKKPAPPQITDIVASPPIVEKPRPITSWLYQSLVLASFLLGTLSGYAMWGRQANPTAELQSPAASVGASNDEGNGMDFAALMKQVNPPQGYELPVRYGDLGPRLLESGGVNYEAFAAVYENAGEPLTQAQVQILKRGGNERITITPENAHFLLNFFWAVGLVNKNPILTEGPIVQNSGGQIDRFASTGGWTLGTKPIAELYASESLISLTPEQQARVEEVASAVYRPCCNNPTIFPDCNHGMAMLGLLELMASQNASVDEMFTAAKYVNAFWFPQQTLETAIYLKANENMDFAAADARTITGADFSSGSGFGTVHQRLQASGLLPQTPGGGGSCGS